MEAKPQQMQQWEGVNERSVPEILASGIFSKSVGVTWRDYNGAGRIKGKQLFASLQTPIINFGISSTQLFIQTTTGLLTTSIDSLLPINETWTDEFGQDITDEGYSTIELI